MGPVGSAAATNPRILAVFPASFWNPSYRPKEFLSLSMATAGAGDKAIAANGRPSTIGSYGLRSSSARFFRDPEVVSGRIPAMAIPSYGSDGNISDPSLVVVSFYKFADFPDHASLRKPLKDLCQELHVSGGIILSPEGINGSICGTHESVERILEFIQSDERLRGLRIVESPVTPEEEAIHHGHTSHSPLGAGEDAPFRWDHVRVKLKKEIVTFGDPRVMPTKTVGKYVHPRDWNALISDPNTE